MIHRGPRRELIRFTVVDVNGTVSFVGDSFFLQPLLAACATGPRTLDDLLWAADSIDKRIREQVLSGLAVFDEHNTPENPQSIKGQLEALEGEEGPVVRVIDETTRAESHRPTRTGFVIFNLKEQRIVQGQNLFGDIARGQAHIHNGERYSRRTVAYHLPDNWNIVP